MTTTTTTTAAKATKKTTIGLEEAIRKARRYVTAAQLAVLQAGQGNGKTYPMLNLAAESLRESAGTVAEEKIGRLPVEAA